MGEIRTLPTLPKLLLLLLRVPTVLSASRRVIILFVWHKPNSEVKRERVDGGGKKTNQCVP